MFCKNCGKEIEDGAKFCPSCGEAIEINAASDEAASAEGVQPQTETNDETDSEAVQDKTSDRSGDVLKVVDWLRVILWIGGGLGMISASFQGFGIASIFIWILAALAIKHGLLVKKGIILDRGKRTLTVPALIISYDSGFDFKNSLKAFRTCTTINLSDIKSIEYANRKNIRQDLNGNIKTQRFINIEMQLTYGSATISMSSGQNRLFSELMDACGANPNFQAYESSRTDVKL